MWERSAEGARLLPLHKGFDGSEERIAGPQPSGLVEKQGATAAVTSTLIWIAGVSPDSCRLAAAHKSAALGQLPIWRRCELQLYGAPLPHPASPSTAKKKAPGNTRGRDRDMRS